MSTIIDAPTELRHHTARITLDPEARSGNPLRLSGYAAVFESESRDLGFIETIAPGAFANALKRADSDPVLLWQHDPAQPLARRSAGSLSLSEDGRGLKFAAKLPGTTLARDAVELVRSGVIASMSFAFSMAGGRETVEERGGQVFRRIIEVGRLHEVSLVTDPAYATTSVEPRSAVLDALRRERVTIRERSSFGADSEHSYFRDMARVELQKAARQAVRGTSPLLENWDPPETIGARTNRDDDTLEHAQRRLDIAHDVWTRAMSTQVGSQDVFAPSSTGAGFVGSMYAAAVRQRAVVAAALRHEPLPKGSMSVYTSRLTVGALAGTAADNASVSQQDATSAYASSPIVTIDGQADAAIQVMDQSPGGAFDTAISEELGKAVAAKLEDEVLKGDGTATHLTGLLNRAGITTVTYTSGSPTLAGVWSAICNLDQQVQSSLGEPADVLAMHPRRREWMRASNSTSALEWDRDLLVIESLGIPTNLGVSVTEDRVVNFASAYCVLLTRPPELRVLSEVLSGTLGVRFQTYMYAALIVRQPAAIGVVAGTGLVSPTFP